MKIEIILIVSLVLICIWFGFFPEYTAMYEKGVKDTHKEAFEKSLMIKEIDKDDRVIYKWIETHKLGYE